MFNIYIYIHYILHIYTYINTYDICVHHKTPISPMSFHLVQVMSHLADGAVRATKKNMIRWTPKA